MDRKHVYVAVVDFAYLADGSIKLFEFGPGICGSGFPEYDFSHPALEHAITSNDYYTRSPMRQLMVSELAKRFAQVYIINVQSNKLSQCLGPEFFAAIKNVRTFKSLESFVLFSKSDEGKEQNAAIIIDRIGNGLSLTEEDFAERLRQHDIVLPVVNAGSYRVFDDKILFAKLFQDEIKSYIPQTWIVSPQTQAQILKEIQSSGIKYFVLKLGISSHARDTVILALDELIAVVPLLNNEGLATAEKKSFKATKPECFKYFLNNLETSGFAFVIREMIQPQPIPRQGGDYCAAGRAVFLACFDGRNQQYDVVQTLASYWQYARIPFQSTAAISHDSHISADIQSVKVHPSSASMITLSSEELMQLKNEYNEPTDLTRMQQQQIMPQLEIMIKNLLSRIAKCTKSQALIDALNHSNPGIKKTALSRLCSSPVMGINSAFLAQVKPLFGQAYPVFVAAQLRFQLLFLRFEARPDFIPKVLLKEFNLHYNHQDSAARNQVEFYPRLIMSLLPATREALKVFAAQECKLLNWVIQSSITTAQKYILAAKEHRVKGREYYDAKRFEEAKTEWMQELEQYKHFCSICPDMIICHSNLSSAYRELGLYTIAITHCTQALDCANELGIAEQQKRLCTKYEQLSQLLLPKPSVARLSP
jgi:tetratricopeptide (TPR) repeat protein